MKKLFGPLLSIVGLLVAIFILSCVFPAVAQFLAWFFIKKEEMNAPITTGQAVIIDVITHILTYSVVGALFSFFGKWDKETMHYCYIIISEIISLGLVILLRFILDYYWVLFIILGVFLITAIFFFIKAKQREGEKNDKTVN